jgi:putative DNA primase/helicase
MMTVAEVLTRLKAVRRCGGGWVARCPGHDDHHPSLSISQGAGGRVLLKCFCGCDYAHIRAALGDMPSRSMSVSRTSEQTASADETRRIDWSRNVWRGSQDPRGTAAQDYLFGRGFTCEMPLPVDTHIDYQLRSRIHVGLSIPPSIRFHAALKHPSGVFLPAMVAAVEDSHGSIVAVHRTFLKANGTGKAEIKPNRLALGPVKGCSVHLTAGGPEMVLCEGIETGLSILQATGLHVWVALGTSNLGQVELPAFVRRVIIAADNDEPGIKATDAASKAYRQCGYQVRIASPRTEKADWNDVLRR